MAERIIDGDISILREDYVVTGQRKQVQDSVHGLISVSPLQWAIINTPQFKRLKGLKQLGTCHEVYPTATNTRFEHSLGVMFIAGAVCSRLPVSPRDRELVEVAALCHDLGHGPFSHLWETFMREAGEDREWRHEEASVKILKEIVKEYPEVELSEDELLFIQEQICGWNTEAASKGEYPYKARGPDQFFLYEIVSNKITGIDVDKWDYMLRDARALGMDTVFDYKRFIEFAKVVETQLFPEMGEASPRVRRIAVRNKEFDNVQDMFTDRSRLHRKAYQHKTVKVFDRMYIDTWLLANKHFHVTNRNGDQVTLAKATHDVTTLVQLTDDWVMQYIRNSICDELGPARELVSRVDTRRIYRTIAHLEQRSMDGGPITTQSLRALVDLVKTTTGGESKLNMEDLALVTININYGRSDKGNPVLSMLFYNKGSNIGHSMTEEELRKVVPQQIADCQVLVVCRREEPEIVEQARSSVHTWAAGLGGGWTILAS